MAALLQRVRQLMRELPISCGGPGRILPLAEHDVPLHRVCQRAYRLRRLRRTSVGMDAHLAEILPEAGLHECAGGLIERPPRRAQYLMHDGRTNLVASDVGLGVPHWQTVIHRARLRGFVVTANSRPSPR